MICHTANFSVFLAFIPIRYVQLFRKNTADLPPPLSVTVPSAVPIPQHTKQRLLLPATCPGAQGSERNLGSSADTASAFGLH